MLAPCLVLCIDLLFSSIEYIFFLDVKLKLTLFESLYLFFEYSNEVIEICHLLRRLDKKLFNLFHKNHVLHSNLRLNSLIFILQLLKKTKMSLVSFVGDRSLAIEHLFASLEYYLYISS